MHTPQLPIRPRDTWSSRLRYAVSRGYVFDNAPGVLEVVVLRAGWLTVKVPWRRHREATGISRIGGVVTLLHQELPPRRRHSSSPTQRESHGPADA
jgi:hypothetical protein